MGKGNDCTSIQGREAEMIFLPPRIEPGMSPEEWDDAVADYLDVMEGEDDERNEEGEYADF